MGKRLNGHNGRNFEKRFLGGSIDSLPADLDFNTCIRLENASNEWNPFDPKPRPANNLHYFITEALGIGLDKLGLYNTLGTSLDDKGIDFFLLYDGFIFTVDITCNICKNSWKADFILQEEDTVDEESIKKVAYKFAERIKGLIATMQ